MTEPLVTVSLPAEKLIVVIEDTAVCLACESDNYVAGIGLVHTPGCPVAKALGQRQEVPA
ncbi:MAG: hypothetical protein ACR2RE_12945 [Geminicoccaceae bacterium]